MAAHSGVLAWRIPGMGKPGGLPSMGLHCCKEYNLSGRRSQDGGGVGRGEHFLPHKFIKRTFKFFHDPADVGNLISGASAFSKTSLNIWKFTVHVLLKPDLENFEHYFTSV